MQIEEIMSSPVETVEPDATLQEATGKMLEHHIGSLVVLDAGPMGILTRSDVLRAAYYTGGSLSELVVKQGMSTDLETVSPSGSIDGALRKMQSNNVKKLPVLDDMELVGIVTMTDIAQYQPERVREVEQTLDRKDDWTS